MEVTYLKAINAALHEEMRRDENVFVMGEDVADLGGAFKATEGLLDAFGELGVMESEDPAIVTLIRQSKRSIVTAAAPVEAATAAA